MDNTLKALQISQLDQTRLPNTVAGAPFDDKDADLILRSCDGTDFHVFKGILILYSPIFRDILSLPSPPHINHHEGGKPVIDMQESSATLGTLLKFCYPTTENPKIATKCHFVDVISGAIKFEMTSLYNTIVDSHLDETVLKVSPLEYYDLAHKLRLRYLAQKSARGGLYLRMEQVIEQSRSIDWANLSVKDFARLLHFFLKCNNACQALISNPSDEPSWLTPADCLFCSTSSQYSTALGTICQRLRLNMIAPRLLTVGFNDFKNCTANFSSRCDRAEHLQHLANLLLEFPKQIEMVIDQVDLELDF
ncbi:hypothetical protein EYR36_001583 [Pleurotus pulmonarius]|nr:hypothetical protein EYR36_001583 [Pleurotus pulmonarius]